MILRYAIYNKIKIKNEDIILKNNYYGKPYLEGYSDFKFNISHSGEYVALVTSKYEVGIDIEQIKEIGHKSIIDNCFTEEEKKYIYKSNSISRFYEMWTLKESYIKAIGKGLSIPLKSFSLNIINKRDIKCINEYVFQIIDVDTRYKMALCSRGKDRIEVIKILNQDALIKDYFRA